MQRLHLRRGEGERVNEALRPLPVAGDEGQRHGSGLACRGEGPSELGDEKGIVALGRRSEGDRAAFFEAKGRDLSGAL